MFGLGDMINSCPDSKVEQEKKDYQNYWQQAQDWAVTFGMNYIDVGIQGGAIAGGCLGYVWDKDGNKYWYWGFGLTSPGVGVSISGSVDSVTVGPNFVFSGNVPSFVYQNSSSNDALQYGQEFGTYIGSLGVSYMFVKIIPIK
jgi:hypothetical protein